MFPKQHTECCGLGVSSSLSGGCSNIADYFDVLLNLAGRTMSILIGHVQLPKTELIDESFTHSEQILLSQKG